MSEKICISLLFPLLVGAFAVVGKKGCHFQAHHASICKDIKLRYYYNEATNKCTHFRWNGCIHEGVFTTRHECVVSCNPGQGADFCAQKPPHVCPEGISSNITRYYYNVTSKTCHQYKTCGRPARLEDVNYFLTKAYCEKQCGGFGLEDVYGNRTGNTTTPEAFD